MMAKTAERPAARHRPSGGRRSRDCRRVLAPALLPLTASLPPGHLSVRPMRLALTQLNQE